MPPFDTQALLERGNKLGEEASELTGVEFDPTPVDRDTTKETVETPTSPDFKEPRSTPSVSVDQVGEQPIQTGATEDDFANRTLSELRDTAASVQAEEDEDVSQAEAQLKQAEERLSGLVGDVQERSQQRAELEQEAGVSEFEQQVADLNSKIQLKQANLSQELEQIGQQGFRAAAVRGQEARARRQVAAEVEGLKAAQEAAKNNIATANERIDRSLRRQFGNLEDRITAASKNLEVNQSQFTRAEKKAARERQAELSRVQSQIADRKARQKTAMQTVNNAIQQGVIGPSRGSELTEGLIQGTISPSQAQVEAGGAIGAVSGGTGTGGGEMTQPQTIDTGALKLTDAKGGTFRGVTMQGARDADITEQDIKDFNTLAQSGMGIDQILNSVNTTSAQEEFFRKASGADQEDVTFEEVKDSANLSKTQLNKALNRSGLTLSEFNNLDPQQQRQWAFGDNDSENDEEDNNEGEGRTF